ncbi:hypothetical protein [Moheibacter lacus]|uniref:Uncharacterized protein n=1 Tax=Moheibacter lacus TaxID=2745851 RepID=A0A838ZRJ2_9FLAO|nr:hypothetical protein [Moheibacter lacus]MBA5628209.1 hypothetical protein [Moheibacter lacus]
MKTKDINTLAELRQAKIELKMKMKRKDNELQGNVINSLANKLFSGKGKVPNYVSTALDKSTRNAIRFLAHRTKRNPRIKRLIKPALITALAIAIPVLVTKAGGLLKEKA